MSIVWKCIKEAADKIRSYFTSMVGNSQFDEVSVEEVDEVPRIRMNSMSRASFELTEHYHKNSMLNKIPISATSSVLSRKSTSQFTEP